MPRTGLDWFMLAARVYALAGAAILVVFIVGSGDFWPPELTLSEGILFAFFPVGVLVGLLAGLVWPRIGGAIATFSLIAFYVGITIDRGTLPRGPYFILFAGAGPLLLIGGWLQARRRAQQD